MTSSLKALLAGLIDYAGLFPPAGLDLQAALRNFAGYQKGPHAWMLGRFVISAARLEELSSALAREPQDFAPKSLTMLSGSDLEEDIERAGRVRQRLPVDSIEVKVSTLRGIDRAARAVPPPLALYCELPGWNGNSELLDAIAAVGARAKIRTGGLVPEAFPSAAEVAKFLCESAQAKAAFKVTAGLHHPVRGARRLTYEPDSPTGPMHGFLNVFLAAVFVQSGMQEGEAAELLLEESAEAFRFDDGGASWRGRRVSTGEIERSRRVFAQAFGSCSFEEPVEDLRSLGLL